ncbi:hypothetical protein QQS21_001284 [Conoideocrella luteorostrata]|uniref:Methyltransferase n=1 Tax=Conoideocrella luteorostrata TaxID=1105319 RepID=A0AAJ0D0S8_9HYPO|nr:hypothetical protein QQS21_001284 [Conoideocrella luteorostrata]
MTTGNFRYLDPASIQDNGPEAWTKVDSDVTSYGRIERRRSVTDIRTSELDFGIDVSGFDVYNSPPTETSFTDEAAVRTGYYAEVESLLRRKLPGVKKVVIFDHTIRRREKSAPRQPVQQVHVDQTSFAAEMRVRRHVCSHEVESLIKGRYQIINVWRPIAYPASDFPLAVIDWSTTTPDDLIKVNLLYPKQTSLADGAAQSEICPDPQSANSTEGYEVKGQLEGTW